MTLTLLIDLDDTLLGNNIQTFLPAYLKALGKHLIEYVPPALMVENLLSATQVMIANNTPTLTLERSFDQVFYPAVGRTKEEMRELLETFYGEVFPGLRDLTTKKSEAVQLVETALALGHTLVVATNPIFPRQAILHRLEWAGLNANQVPFALVTDYERFHFAKPNPAFFAEILAQLAWPNQPAVVIGNSLEDDLLPAAQLGLPVFWVQDHPVEIPPGLPPFSASGRLDEVVDWIKQVDQENPRQPFSTPPALLALLKATPAALDTFCLGLSDRQWCEHPAPGEWSLTEVLCHLRDVDREVNIPRLEKVITEDNPFIAGLNTDSWAKERDYYHQDGRKALKEFISARDSLIRELETLTGADWERQVRHAIFGPTTLRELVSFTTTHDRTHIQQAHASVHALV